MQIDEFPRVERPQKEAKSSNVKFSKKYERFGEIIRYLTADELNQFFDSVDNNYHKLMFQTIYELGCRVGEFVRIQVKHSKLNYNFIDKHVNCFFSIHVG